MNIGFIGCGNLGQAITRGILNSNFDGEIYINTTNEQSLSNIKSLFPTVNATLDKKQLISCSDIIFLAFKPKHFNEVLPEILECDLSNKQIISLLAGVKLNTLISSLATTNVLRVIPTISSSVNTGIIALCHDNIDISPSFNILSELGRIIDTSEEELEKVTIVASCGLAFVTKLIDCYITASTCLLDKPLSTSITLETFNASIALLSGGLTTNQLIGTVATKGGVTEQGLQNINSETITKMLSDAMSVAYEKVK